MATLDSEPLLKSLDLSLRILDSFESDVQSRRVTEVARDFGVSKATTYRVLATLERHGYLVQNPVTEEYALGPRLRRFGQLATARFDLPEEARPFMVELRDLTEDTIHLAVLEGGEAVYVAREQGRQAVQVASRIGARCPAHCVATGKVLLAHAAPDVQAQTIGNGMERHTDLTHATPEAIRAELGRVRGQGYAVNLGEWRREVRGIAAPVRDVGGVVAAIGVCSPASRMDDARVADLIPIMVDAATRLSARLGAPADPPVGRGARIKTPTTPA
ncbi:MAG: IclR family transcriptional regulator [Thermomicrobiales bacterium]